MESSLNGNFKLNAEGRAENAGFIPLNYASSSSLNKYTFNPIKSNSSQRDLNMETSLNGNFKLNADGRAENGGLIPLNYASSSSLNKYTFNPIKSNSSQRDLNVEASLNGNFKLNADGRAENGGFIPLNYASSSSLNKYTFNPITVEF